MSSHLFVDENDDNEDMRMFQFRSKKLQLNSSLMDYINKNKQINKYRKNKTKKR